MNLIVKHVSSYRATMALDRYPVHDPVSRQESKKGFLARLSSWLHGKPNPSEG